MTATKLLSLLTTCLCWFFLYVELVKQAFAHQWFTYSDPIWFALSVRAILLVSSLLIVRLALRLLDYLLES